MPKAKGTLSLKRLHWVLGAFLVVSVVVLVIIGFSVQYRDLAETYTLADETTSFVKDECAKYDNYTRGNSASSLQNLLDSADGLSKFISTDELTDSDFLDDFIRTEHIGGIIVFDADATPVAQADMDDQDSSALWSDVVSGINVSNILQHPQKTYVDCKSINGKPYNMATVVSSDGAHLIMCYSSMEKPASDPYELTVASILKNNSFYKNPTLVIASGGQILSTNSSVVEAADASQLEEFASSVPWKSDKLTEFRYDDATYYGLHKVYGVYDIYAVYASGDVFTHRTGYISFALMLYLGVGIVILVFQRRSDRLSIDKMEKQLRTINAISTAYDSTFLLHADRMELEPIRPSERLGALFEKHRDPYDFLLAVCESEVADDCREQVMHFLDLDTVVGRLRDEPFLGCEVKDRLGVWYSLSLIPQKRGENGDVLAFLVATKNISSMKQAEALSFRDGLTGLLNRNYMESKGDDLVRADDLPASLIMADCNYLKRTNDTLGHGYGDLLLQRVANSITDAIPHDCIAMRIGGDEFLVLCPKHGEADARRFVADIEQGLAARSDETLPLSAAFGVCTITDEGTSFEQAFEAADKEMYRNKKASRAQR